MLRSVVLLAAVGTSLSAWGLPADLSLANNASAAPVENVADDNLLAALNPFELLRNLSDALTAAAQAQTEEEYESAVRDVMDNATEQDMARLFGRQSVAELENGSASELIEFAGGGAAMSIQIDLGRQSLVAYYPGGTFGPIPISSARAGYVTPRGRYGVTGMERMHYSKKYHNSPMPHSLFFRGGYAIHGTNAVGLLGRPASHGCVRVSPAHAAQLYSLVQEHNRSVRISIY